MDIQRYDGGKFGGKIRERNDTRVQEWVENVQYYTLFSFPYEEEPKVLLFLFLNCDSFVNHTSSNSFGGRREGSENLRKREDSARGKANIRSYRVVFLESPHSDFRFFLSFAFYATFFVARCCGLLKSARRTTFDVAGARSEAIVRIK